MLKSDFKVVTRYKSKNTYTWSPAIAYSVGLIASDGCLYKDQRHISLVSVDMEILTNFSKSLGKDFTISNYNTGHDVGADAYRIQIGDVAYYDFLLGNGITPAKSKTIGKLLVPDDYYADFLRGEFDGDGSIWGYWDPRWRSSLMYYTQFTSASFVFLAWLQYQNSRLIGTTLGEIYKGKKAISLKYAKSDSQKIFKFMYYSLDSLKLTRKYNKFVAFLKMDPYSNKDVLLV